MKPLTEKDVAELAPRAIVALAVRCAQRVIETVRASGLSGFDKLKVENALENAIEIAAGTSRSILDPKPWSIRDVARATGAHYLTVGRAVDVIADALQAAHFFAGAWSNEKEYVSRACVKAVDRSIAALEAIAENSRDSFAARSAFYSAIRADFFFLLDDENKEFEFADIGPLWPATSICDDSHLINAGNASSKVAGSLCVNFDSDVYSAIDSGELLSLFSELYNVQTGDRLVVDSTGIKFLPCMIPTENSVNQALKKFSFYELTGNRLLLWTCPEKSVLITALRCVLEFGKHVAASELLGSDKPLVENGETLPVRTFEFLDSKTQRPIENQLKASQTETEFLKRELFWQQKHNTNAESKGQQLDNIVQQLEIKKQINEVVAGRTEIHILEDTESTTIVLGNFRDN